MRVPSGKRASRPPWRRIVRAVSRCVLVGLAAAHGEGAEPHEQAPIARLDQLGSGHEAEVPAGADRDEERVPEALVVRGHDRRALARYVLGPRHVHAEVRARAGLTIPLTVAYSGRDTPFSRARRCASSFVMARQATGVSGGSH